MYYIDDRKSVIEAVQKHLLVIYEKGDKDIGRVSIDGIFGSETKEAIRKYQMLSGIEPSGTVNRVTFDSLYNEYKEITEEGELLEIPIGEGVFPLSFGMQGNDVLLLHLYLLELEKRYRDLGTVDKSTYFSKRTENAVKNLQRIFREKESGEVDKRLFNRIIKELYSIKLANEEYV